MSVEKQKRERRAAAPKWRCDDCEFFDENESEEASCMMALDEDEFADFVSKNTGRCPYFRFYDEYKTVQKQN